MTNLNLIGIDLAKNVFQLCGLSSKGKVIENKQLKRRALLAHIAKQKPTVIAMEACYSSHYWAREFSKLGHEVKLLPAQHVKPFVVGNKSDSNDALAICEAARRPNIKCVPIKTVEQHDIQCLHRLRERHVAHRTGLINQARGLLSEYGIIAPQGLSAFLTMLREYTAPTNSTLSAMLKKHLSMVADEFHWHTEQIEDIQLDLKKYAENNELCKYLLSIPGVGVINATSIYSAIGDGSQFKSAREFAVWLGLTPKQSGSGEKNYTGSISKRGNRYLRKQLIHGARAAVTRSKKKSDALSIWVNKLVERRGAPKAYVAMAARMARIAWVLLQRRENFKAV